MSEPPPFDQQTASRWFAVECNNNTWDLLEKPNRTVAETDGMIHMAHAACFHWMQVGTPLHQVRAICLVANAHAAAGNGELALRYALSVMEAAKALGDEVADWDWAFLYDATSRAYAAAGQADSARQWREKARAAGDAIADNQSRDMFQQFFANWPFNE